MSWVCPMCSTSNQEEFKVCFVCDTPRKKKPISKAKQNEMFLKASEFYNSGKYSKAIPHLQKLAENNHIPATVMLAKCYQNANGVTQDLREAYGWFLKAAKGDDAEAQYEVACCYYLGKGTKRHFFRAMSWLEKAWKNQYIPAIKLLATFYITGEGVDIDCDRALALLKEVEELYQREETDTEDLELLYFIGLCYVMKEMRKEALHYLKRAAENGQIDAMFELGSCYEKGYVFFFKKRRATYWYNQAKDNGHKGAKTALKRMGR